MTSQRLLAAVAGQVALAAMLVFSTAAQAQEEFVGPFPSWLNAKADFGAVGDGKADDTDALQKALDTIRNEKAARKVLYLPAGTYRITRTLQLLRATHNESTGISILGEDPETTVIRWDGPADGVMFLYNPWYSRMGRIAMDGAGKAATAIRHGEKFTTANEFADMIFRDVGFGIEAGMKAGIAETPVLRCKFLRCSKAGASLQDFNSLDWWFWHCVFEDCRVGVTNRFGAGHFHVYESEFRRSTEADMTMGNTEYFGIRDNLSVNSAAFFVAGGIGAGAPITFQRNLIVHDSKTQPPIRIGNLGPVLLLDNTVRTLPEGETHKGPVVALSAGTAAASVGNLFAATDPIKPGERFAAMDDRVDPRMAFAGTMPPPPGPLKVAKRQVIEVAAGADAAAIQGAIDEAARLAGNRPVVHLAAGKYRVSRTLVVPAGCDVQLAGDGILNATTLEWTGEGAGPLLALKGPSRATLCDLGIAAGKKADAIVLSTCDQDGGRVFMEQALVSAAEVGLAVEGLARTNVDLRDFGHSGCAVGVRVVGTGERAEPKGGRVVIFSGASSNNKLSYDVSRGGWLLARDIWYESGNEPRFMRCTDSGTFTLHGANVAYPRGKGVAGIEVDNFRGRLSFLGVTFSDVSKSPGEAPAVVVRGEGRDTRVLLLGCHGNGEYFANESPSARAARLLGVEYTPGGGAKPIADVGKWDDAFVREMLQQTRAAHPQPLLPAPAGATDARLFRVMASGRSAIVLKPGE